VDLDDRADGDAGSEVEELARVGAREVLDLAPRIPLRSIVEVHPLERAEEALGRLRDGRVEGAAVLQVTDPAQ